MKLIDPAHPFYRPFWVRALIVGSCTFWAAVEAIIGDPFFMVILAALAGYSGRVLFLNYKLPDQTDAVDGTSAAKKTDTQSS